MYRLDSGTTEVPERIDGAAVLAPVTLPIICSAMLLRVWRRSLAR